MPERAHGIELGGRLEVSGVSTEGGTLFLDLADGSGSYPMYSADGKRTLLFKVSQSLATMGDDVIPFAKK